MGSLACVAALLLGCARAQHLAQARHHRVRHDSEQYDSSWGGFVPENLPSLGLDPGAAYSQTRYLAYNVASKEDSGTRVAAVLHNCTCSLFLVTHSGDQALCARVKVRTRARMCKSRSS